MHNSLSQLTSNRITSIQLLLLQKKTRTPSTESNHQTTYMIEIIPISTFYHALQYTPNIMIIVFFLINH